MQDKQLYTVNLGNLGTLVAEFIAEDSLRVRTEFDGYHYDGGQRVEDKGTRIVLNRVEYEVDAMLHPRGSCLRERPRDSSGWQLPANTCSDPHTFGWALGSVRHKGVHGQRIDGELEPSSSYITLRRGGYGKDASWAARGVVGEKIAQAVATLVRTVPNGPEQARIENLRKALVVLDALAAKLREEAHQANEAAERIRQELFSLGLVSVEAA